MLRYPNRAIFLFSLLLPLHGFALVQGPAEPHPSQLQPDTVAVRFSTDLTDSLEEATLELDSLRADPTEHPSFTRAFYERMKGVFHFGAHQLVILDSTLTVPADSTQYDSTLVGQVGGGMLYVSRRMYEGVLFAFNYGTAAVEPERILQIKDFLDIPDSPLGWYPVVVGSSYYRVAVGGKVYYRSPTIGGSVDASIVNRTKWSSRLRFTLRRAVDQQVHQVNVTLQRRQDDDMEFYGIGQSPRKDPRSHFRPDSDEEYGLFHQDFNQAQMILGWRTGKRYEIRGTWIFQQRRISVAWEEEKSLGEVFDVSSLSGSIGELRDLYQEVAYRYDNRQGLEGQGWTSEVYGGLVTGLGDDRRIVRYGLDAHGNMRIFGTHTLVPRLVTNIVYSINPDQPLSFTDYPRHPTFRAIADRKLLRSDNILLVPAIDVHNRLSKQLSGRVFLDYLLATPSLDRLQPGNGMIGVGVGLVIYTKYTDVAGLIVSYCEIGPRVSLFIGAEPNRNERSRWR